jgi:hypothetical protein
MFQQGRLVSLNAEYDHAYRGESHRYHRYDLEGEHSQHATLRHVADLRHQVQPRMVALAAAALTAAFALINL